MMSLLTWMVVIIGFIALALMGYLTYVIYTSDQEKQRASVEPEYEDFTELT